MTKFYVGQVVDKESLEERKKNKNNENKPLFEAFY